MHWVHVYVCACQNVLHHITHILCTTIQHTPMMRPSPLAIPLDRWPPNNSVPTPLLFCHSRAMLACCCQCQHFVIVSVTEIITSLTSDFLTPNLKLSYHQQLIQPVMRMWALPIISIPCIVTTIMWRQWRDIMFKLLPETNSLFVCWLPCRMKGIVKRLCWCNDFDCYYDMSCLNVGIGDIKDGW